MPGSEGVNGSQSFICMRYETPGNVLLPTSGFDQLVAGMAESAMIIIDALCCGMQARLESSLALQLVALHVWMTQAFCCHIIHLA